MRKSRIAGLSFVDIITAKPLRLINEGPLAEMYAGLQMIAGTLQNLSGVRAQLELKPKIPDFNSLKSKILTTE